MGEYIKFTVILPKSKNHLSNIYCIHWKCIPTESQRTKFHVSYVAREGKSEKFPHRRVESGAHVFSLSWSNTQCSAVYATFTSEVTVISRFKRNDALEGWFICCRALWHYLSSRPWPGYFLTISHKLSHFLIWPQYFYHKFNTEGFRCYHSLPTLASYMHLPFLQSLATAE